MHLSGKELVAPAKHINLTLQQRLNIRQLSYYQSMKDEEYTAETIYKLWPTDKESYYKAGARPSITAIKQFKATEEYRELMLEVGIEVTDVSQMNERQLMTLNALADAVISRKSKTAILKEMGVSSVEWRGWMRQKEFNDSWNAMASRALTDSIPMAEIKLAEMAEAGDLQTIKFLFEVTGRYNPAQQQAIDAQALMNVMIDAAQEIFGKADPELFSQYVELIRLKASTVKGMIV